MTFWDNRGFLSLASLNAGENADYGADPSYNNANADEAYFRKPDPSVPKPPRKRTTATPVARAPRFLAPKLDPSIALLTDDKLNENGMPANLDELMNSAHQGQYFDSGSMAAGGYSRAANRAVTASGSHLKNMSKEKLDEIVSYVWYSYVMRMTVTTSFRTSPCDASRSCNNGVTPTAPVVFIVEYAVANLLLQQA